jgi:hypothetical protein
VGSVDGTSNCCVRRGDGDVVLLVCTNVPSTVFGVVVDPVSEGSVVVVVTMSSMTVLVVKVTEIVRVILPSTSVVTTVTGTVVVTGIVEVTEMGSDATAPSNVFEAELETESEPAEAESDLDRASVADRRLSVAVLDTTPVRRNRPLDLDVEELFATLCSADWLLLPDTDTTKPFVNTEVVVLEGSVVTGTVVVIVVVKVLADSPNVTVISSVIVVTTLAVVAKTTASVPVTDAELVELFDEISNSTAPPRGEPAVNTIKLEVEFVKSA